MPPTNVVEWTGGGANDNWETGGNWSSGSPPLSGANVLFGDAPVGGTQPAPTDEAIRQTVNFGSDNRTLRSLWFKAGQWYTLSGTGELTLGQGGGQDGYLLVVNKGDAGEQSEHTIEGFSHFTVSWPMGQIGKIENYSEGGLGIFSQYIANWGQHIQIDGTGATHLTGKLVYAKTFTDTGSFGTSGVIQVGTSGGGAPHLRPQLILSGDNREWFGELRVNKGAFAIIKADQALGKGGTRGVLEDGGSIALRSHVGKPLNYGVAVEAPTTALTVIGEGIVRAEGTGRIGTLYNDGGLNRFDMPIHSVSVGDTFFGARGDRAGGLILGNYIIAPSFTKVGAGLIALEGRSNLSLMTIRGGVLRISGPEALLPTNNLVLDGGILELGYGDLSRTLGVWPGQMLIHWLGSGGFSAYGADRSVTIGSASDVLTWGFTANFLGRGDALLLSSRYANANITLTNAINLGFGGSREIRVERGEGNAHAILSGNLSGAGGGLLKTGDGLLELNGSNSYTGETLIRGGALRGNLPSSNIGLDGGVLGIDSDFSRALLTGSNLWLRWSGSGGFAAYGGAHSVTLGEGEGALTWGGGVGFVAADKELRFGHYTATGTVLWEKMLYLGDEGGPRVMRIERGSDLSRADVAFLGAIDGAKDLWFVGNGRIDLTSGNGFFQQLGPIANIYGAEVRLNKSGFLPHRNITIGHGGTLFLDDLGTYDSETGGTGNSNRVHDDGTLTLAGGTLAYRRGTAAVEKVGTITLGSGQNSIQLFAPPTGAGGARELHAAGLTLAGSSRAVLHFSEAEARLRFDTSASGHNVGTETDGIAPWATAALSGGSEGFAQATTENGVHYLKALETYHTGGTSGWNSALNVRMATFTQTLNANTGVNSLIIRSGNLAFVNSTLTLNSGGLIASGGGNMNGTGTITTGGTRPFYVHTFSDLLVQRSLFFSGGMDLVKSQAGTLILNSDGTHNVGNVYLHRGTLDLRDGTLSVRDRITIGDGSGNTTLKLASDRWNQIVKTGGGLPNITLNGTPYDPRGPEYGGNQAILQMGGNTKLVLANLHIENRGTIDWAGGEVAKANILWIDTLSFNNPAAQLFIRNWYENEDMLLVRRANFNTALLPQIIFEGYQDYHTIWKDYDNSYIQITPFGIVPEPSTYGAILGIVGLAVVVWRKRRKTVLSRRGPNEGLAK